MLLKFVQNITIYFSDGSSIRKSDFCVQQVLGWTQIEQDFSSFFANFMELGFTLKKHQIVYQNVKGALGIVHRIW